MEKDTIWRLTVDDFMHVIEGKYPEMTQKEIQQLLETARNKFTVHDWTELVEIFIDCHKP
jgi:hypothetical protein